MFEWLPGGVNADIWFMMALIFVLGFFIEWIEISYIAVPLFLPVLLNQGVDPVWLAMLITVNLQSSFLTPPFGWALFYLKGVAPPEVSIRDIYRGVVPFIMLQAGDAGCWCSSTRRSRCGCPRRSAGKVCADGGEAG
jgi:TRAP-type mannitol/chloroaromatic compound transport system permease large subunit